MRFWDASALVPLLVGEARSARARELLEIDPDIVVWWSAPVECWSALARLTREGTLQPEVADQCSATLDVLRGVWYEVVPTDAVRSRARRLLRLHALRAGDALQLAAALVWARDEEAAEFVSADQRLCDAARLEGLSVVRL